MISIHLNVQDVQAVQDDFVTVPNTAIKFLTHL